jgi:NAD(P)H dehydrogenase (quinone)
MVNICIVHHSITGTTSRLAASVLEGVGSVDGCIGKVLAINGKDIVDGRFKNEAVLRALDASDAMIFGCPTYMGGAFGSVQGACRCFQ